MMSSRDDDADAIINVCSTHSLREKWYETWDKEVVVVVVWRRRKKKREVLTRSLGVFPFAVGSRFI